MAGREMSSLRDVRSEAMHCQRCDLWRHATQTVFGEGARRPAIMLVGEQSGDVEDREGEPFVGPAGQLLRDALQEAGIDLATVYLTNAVKHFKWEPRGKKRIHLRPDRTEVSACHIWLEAEIGLLKPPVLVALGATAASAMLDPNVRVTRDRAKPIQSPLAPFVTVTVHPSSILRSIDSTQRGIARKAFVDDLRSIATHIPRESAKGAR